jgi:ribosome maturation factor RimP
MFKTTEQIENEIFDIAEKYVEEFGGYVLDVNLKGSRGSRIAVVIADTETGITLDELASVSKQTERDLDESELLTEKYTLEVTSPGMDRPMTDARDFRRRKGQKARVEHTMLEPAEPVEGEIHSISEESVTIKSKEQGELVIPFDQIVRAKLLLDW